MIEPQIAQINTDYNRPAGLQPAMSTIKRRTRSTLLRSASLILLGAYQLRAVGKM